MIMDVRPLQPLKAYSPISVTLSGIIIDVRPLHPLKAESSILVTLSGMRVSNSYRTIAGWL